MQFFSYKIFLSIFCVLHDFSFPLPQNTLNMSWCQSDSVEHSSDSTTQL